MKNKMLPPILIGIIGGIVEAFLTVYTLKNNELIFATAFLLLTCASISLGLIGIIIARVMKGDDDLS